MSLEDFSERFATYFAWPLSRKVVMLGMLGVFTTMIAGTVNYVVRTLAGDSVMALEELDAFITTWTVAQAAATLIAVPAAREGRDTRWLAYLFVGVQGAFMAGLLHLFGTMASPLVAIFPALVILWTLVLDEYVGLFGLAVMVPCIFTFGVLEANGTLPFAPVLRDRAIDAQSGGIWFSTVFFNICWLMGVCLSLCILVLRSRRVQEKRLLAAHNALETATRLIRRYAPAQVVEQILAGRYEESAGAARRRLTIVCTDIEGFTTASESLTGPRLETMFNEYLARMTTLAEAHGGTLSVVDGDAITVLFGAPQVTNDRDHASRAVRMALEMQAQVQVLSAQWRENGFDRPLRLRVGINTGEAIVGDFGPPGRKLYAAIGLEASIAGRIRHEAVPGRVLVSRSTWALVRTDFPATPKGEIGPHTPGRTLAVYEVSDSQQAA